MTQTAGESLRTHTHTPRCTQVECQRSPAERMPHNSSTQFSAVNPPPTRPRTHTAKPPSADRNEEHNEMCVNRRRGSPPRRSHGKSTSAVCSKPELWTTSGVCVCVSVCVPSSFKCHKRSAAAAAQARAGAANHDMHTPPTHTHTKRECETQTTQRQRTLHLHTYRRDTDVSMPEASSIGDASPPTTSPPPPSPDHQGHAALCFFLRVMQARSKAVCSIK